MRNSSKKQGWNLLCAIDSVSIDLKTRVATIHVPEDQSPDMTKTINAVLSVDPLCEAIDIFQDGEIEVSYELENGKWALYFYQKYCPDQVSNGVDV
jgi:hypothetical protein